MQGSMTVLFVAWGNLLAISLESWQLQEVLWGSSCEGPVLLMNLMKSGDGSIPINTIFRGMNIHLPAILMFTRGTRFWHTAIWWMERYGKLKAEFQWKAGNSAMAFPWFSCRSFRRSSPVCLALCGWPAPWCHRGHLMCWDVSRCVEVQWDEERIGVSVIFALNQLLLVYGACLVLSHRCTQNYHTCTCDNMPGVQGSPKWDQIQFQAHQDIFWGSVGFSLRQCSTTSSTLWGLWPRSVFAGTVCPASLLAMALAP